jgi:hypothetical protein
MLQETHSCKEHEQIWESEWGYKIIYSHGSSNSRGVCILFKNNFNLIIHDTITDDEGRYVIADISIDNYRLSLVNIYGPNSDTPDFFTNLYLKLNDISNETQIIGGDFNCVLNPTLDKYGGNINAKPLTRRFLLSWLEEDSICDIWRKHNPMVKQYTWEKNKPTNIKCRLDYFLCSFNIQHNVLRSDIVTGFKSDHKLIYIVIKTGENKRGPGLFRLNCSLLENENYVNLITNTIQESITEAEEINMSPHGTWEYMKYKIRKETIKFAAKLNRDRNLELKNLEEKLQKLNSILNRNENENQELKDTRVKVEDIYSYKARGAQIRARANYYEYGEKSSKYFINMEKRHFNTHTINKLKTENDEIITDKESLLKEFTQFYRGLYQSNGNTDLFIDTVNEKHHIENLPKLSPQESVNLENPINQFECKKIIQSMPKNKSPGCDGLPVEFYLKFWDKIKDPYIQALNFSFQEGHMSTTQQRSIITLLPKKGKDLELLKSWRPISLLNTDYKIATKIIAERINTVIKQIVHVDQTGFIKGRYIGENIRRLLDIIEHCNNKQIPALYMFIDFEKAFDRLEWSFIDKTLALYNFGDNIRSWVKCFYNNANASVSNNGWVSDTFKITRGVRQGCPLSPYLFILCSELLAVSIRNNPNINGISVNEKESKICQYADDTYLTLEASSNNLKEVLNEFSNFEQLSGLKINYDKTVVLRGGSLASTGFTLLPEVPLKWTNSQIEILGILVGNDLKSVLIDNYLRKIEKLRIVLCKWYHRNMSIFGKIAIVKSIALSQLIYLASILPKPPKYLIDSINKHIYEFIWNKKPDKIKRVILSNNSSNLGANLTNFEAMCDSLKIAWVKRLLDDTNTGYWKHLMYQKLPNIDINILFKCNLFHKHVKNLHIDNNFVKEMLEAWCKYNFKNTEEVENTSVGREIIWYNSNILINKEPFCNKKLLTKGLMYIQDLFDAEGLPLTVDTLKTKYECNINILHVYSILSAIPKPWKNILKLKLPLSNIIYSVTKICNIRKVCSYVYPNILEKYQNVKSGQCTVQRWNKMLQGNLELEELQNKFNQTFFATISNKLRSFQFRFLHCALATNILLYKCGHKNSDMCTFCDSEKETPLHLFWSCKISQIFWYNVLKLLKLVNTCNEITNFKFEILFNFCDINYAVHNLIFILGKQYLYYCKCNNHHPEFHVFINRVKECKIIEKQIATVKGKIRAHNAKWQNFSDDTIS